MFVAVIELDVDDKERFAKVTTQDKIVIIELFLPFEDDKDQIVPQCGRSSE